MKKKIKILLIGLGSLIGLFLLTAVLVATVFEDEVKRLFINEINKQLTTELKLDEDDVSFSLLKNFPSASLTIKNVELASNGVGGNNELLSLGSVTLNFNPFDLIRKNYEIKTVRINKGSIKLYVDPEGNPNYTVWKKSKSTNNSEDALEIALKKAILNDVYVSYINEKIVQQYSGTVEHGTLSGNFSTSNFDIDIHSDLNTELIMVKSEVYADEQEVELETRLALNTKKEQYEFQNTKLLVADNKMDVTGIVKLVEEGTELDIHASGSDLDMGSMVSLIPGFDGQDLLASKGNLEFKLDVVGLVTRELNPAIDMSFALNEGTISIGEIDRSIEDVDFAGSFTNGKDHNQASTIVTVNRFSGTIDEQPVQMSFKLNDLNDPYLHATAVGNFAFDKLYPLLNLEGMESPEGMIRCKDLVVQGKVGPKPMLSAEGLIALDDLAYKTEKGEQVNLDGSFLLNKENIQCQDINWSAGRSDLKINGTVANLVEFLITSEFHDQVPGDVMLDLAVEGKNLDIVELNELFSSEQNEPTTAVDETTVEESVNLADHIRGSVIAEIGEISYGNILVKRPALRAGIKPGNLEVISCTGETAGGNFNYHGNIGTLEKGFTMNGVADCINIDVRELFEEFSNFDQNTLKSEHLKGRLNATVNFNCKWDEHGNLNQESLTANIIAKIEDGELIKFKPMEALSAFVKVDELKHIRFSELSNTITIAGKVINIPAMTIESNAANIDLVGTHHFDNTINYAVKLNLLDVVGKKLKGKGEGKEFEFEEVENGSRINIYVTMTGSALDPKIEMDRKRGKELFPDTGTPKILPSIKEILKPGNKPNKDPQPMEVNPLKEEDDPIEFLDWEEDEIN